MDALSRDRREANVAFGGSYHPQKSRRRQAPAHGPAAVYSLAAPFGTKRRTPAPCSWGGCASTRSQRLWSPTLSARRRQAPARGPAAVYSLAAPFGTKRRTPAPCSWGGCASTRSQRLWSPTLSARRRQAPARGPAAVYSLYRPIRNETQNARPLLVGRAFVDLEPTATGRPHCGHSRILVTTPEPTVRPPSRIAKRRPSSHAIGVIKVISMSMLSPGITISTPSGSLMLPVTSVVRK